MTYKDKLIKQLREEISELRIVITRQRRAFEQVPDNTPLPIHEKLRNIINEVGGVDITMRVRQRQIVDCRRMYFHWLCFNTDMSLNDIAKSLNTAPFHHSSVIHARDSHEDLMVYSRKYSDIYASVNELMGRHTINNIEETELVLNAS